MKKILLFTAALLSIAFFYSCNKVENISNSEDSLKSISNEYKIDEEVREEMAHIMVKFKSGLEEFYVENQNFDQFKTRIFNDSNHHISNDADSLLYFALVLIEENISDDYIMSYYQGAEIAKIFLYLLDNPDLNEADYFNYYDNEAFQALGGCKWYQVGCHLRKVWSWVSDNTAEIAASAAAINVGINIAKFLSDK